MRGLLLGVALLAGLAGCGDDGSSAGTPAAVPASPPADFLVGYLKDWYYWFDRLPAAIDPAAYANADAALAALRVPEDRFSYIESAQTYNAFFDQGRALGFGLSYQVDGDAAALRMVQPDSPAYAAGLRRGDRIVTIDSVPVPTLVAAGTLAEAFGPVQVGITRRFEVRRGAQTVPITVAKDWYSIRYVLAQGVSDVAGRRVGYVNFFSFADPGIAAWQSALDSLLAAGAQDLVVDLRENGGGLLATAASVGSALGAGDLNGREMDRLVFNTRHPEANRSFAFVSDPRAGRFDRIVFLTSGRTCSASEALIAGLMPWRTATRIGTTTCGKPVGFTPPTDSGFVYSIVSFSTENANGYGNYMSGIAPDCIVADPIAGSFGSAGEPLLAAALEWLSTGACPAAAGPTGPATKGLATRADADTGLPGLSRLTGLR